MTLFNSLGAVPQGNFSVTLCNVSYCGHEKCINLDISSTVGVNLLVVAADNKGEALLGASD